MTGDITCILWLVRALALACLDQTAERILHKQQWKTGEVIKLTDVKDFSLPLWFIFITCVCYYVAVFPFIGLRKDFFTEKFGFFSQTASDINSIVFGLLVDKTGSNIICVQWWPRLLPTWCWPLCCGTLGLLCVSWDSTIRCLPVHCGQWWCLSFLNINWEPHMASCSSFRILGWPSFPSFLAWYWILGDICFWKFSPLPVFLCHCYLWSYSTWWIISKVGT